LNKDLLAPKFLTSNIATLAVERVFDIVFTGAGVLDFVRNEGGHITIIVPTMEEMGHRYPDYPIHPDVLFERSRGELSDWKYDYTNIARCKALQLWHNRNDDRTDCIPHLLFPGDTPFWGGVNRHGIVVAYSGEKPYIDKMISGMVADMCVGLAYATWMTSDDKKATDSDACFIK
jgi:hypothetical protein